MTVVFHNVLRLILTGLSYVIWFVLECFFYALYLPFLFIMMFLVLPYRWLHEQLTREPKRSSK